MIEIKQAEMNKILLDPKMTAMLEKVLVDGVSVGEAHSYLRDWASSFELLINDSIIGYFTVQHSENPGYAEAHAYVFPESRRYSTHCLKAIVAYLQNLGYKVQTSVLGNFPHVLRTLKAIGFSVIGVEDSAFTKEGISYPIFHLNN